MKEVLVTVKAYPNPSKSYQETVCVAGISDGEWIRLYPIQFRNLPLEKTFRKYELIRVMVRKHQRDPRPESYRPDESTIERLAYLGTGRDPGWTRRKRLVLPTVSASMCKIHQMQQLRRTSLGMFRPQEVSSFRMVRDKDEWTTSERYFQLALFGRNQPPAERLPVSFKYRYRCADMACPGHDMKIIDWEAGELYRRLRAQHGGDARAIETKMRQKWLDQMFAESKDPYFFVGNLMAYPGSFVILGVFWPPASRMPEPPHTPTTLF